jgi:hypothetical protein
VRRLKGSGADPSPSKVKAATRQNFVFSLGQFSLVQKLYKQYKQDKKEEALCVHRNRFRRSSRARSLFSSNRNPPQETTLNLTRSSTPSSSHRLSASYHSHPEPSRLLSFFAIEQELDSFIDRSVTREQDEDESEKEELEEESEEESERSGSARLDHPRLGVHRPSRPSLIGGSCLQANAGVHKVVVRDLRLLLTLESRSILSSLIEQFTTAVKHAKGYADREMYTHAPAHVHVHAREQAHTHATKAKESTFAKGRGEGDVSSSLPLADKAKTRR